METDTIAAIITPLGESGIAVIRVSGEDALPIVDTIYKGKYRLINVESHTVHYGYIIDPNTRDKVDEVLVTVMRAPRTFTKEDVVEISCHGGIVLVQRVLELLLASNSRLAEPGEFTKRAFLNGRIDLSQAEAVIDLIRSKTDRTSKIAFDQVGGALSRKVKDLRSHIVETIAHLAVNVDYPEYDAEELTNQFVLRQCGEIKIAINQLLRTARQGKILREGLKTAIVGRPNVGKSSLMNALTGVNKAIVTDIPGTTRDVVEEYVNIKGVPLRLLDTAGIRETEDVVEKIGVEKSYQVLDEAELILLLLNSSEPLQEEDKSLLRKTRSNKEVIIILNKTDLPPRIEEEEIFSYSGMNPLIRVSLAHGEGVNEIGEAVSRMFLLGNIEADDATYVSNVRHIHLLEKAKLSMEEAMTGIEAGVPLDISEIDIKNAWEYLGEIIGDAVSEDLIDQIFSQFCLGK